MKKFLQFTCFLLLSLYLSTSFAVRMKSLYQADIPVASQQTPQRAEAFRNGLIQVLIRVSGDTDIAKNATIKAALPHADTFVDEYSYAPSHTPPPAPPTILEAHFDPASISQLLREANAPAWSQNRPLIILWIANNLSPQGVHIVSSDSDQDITALLKAKADQRGLPIIFPLMDLSEIEHVSLTDVGTDNFAILSNVSKRYGSNAIITGRLFHEITGYHFALTLQLPTEQLKWDVTGASVPTVLSGAIDRIADTLATRYASVVTQQVQSSVTITVTNILQSSDMDKCLQYLEHLAPVANINIVQVSGQSVVLQLSLRGTLSALTQAISAEGYLTPIANTDQQPTPYLTWQWKG